MNGGKRIDIMKKRVAVILLLSFGLAGTVLPLQAETYRYADEKGVLHFTNTPTSSKFKPWGWGRTDRRLWRNANQYISSYSPDRYNQIIAEASRKHGIDVPLVKAIIKAESNFNPRAVSRAGAMGLMQLMPVNWSALRITDPFDPEQNIMGGTLYFKRLLNRFNGNVHYALAAYNAGPASVDRFNRIPPIRETQEYVRKVMGYYKAFKKGSEM